MSPSVTPPTTQQQTAFQFILANLYEQEGLRGENVADAWLMAAHLLLEQLKEEYPLVVLPAAQTAEVWSSKAVQAIKEARSGDSKTVKGIEGWAKRAKNMPALQAAEALVSSPSIACGIFADVPTSSMARCTAQDQWTTRNSTQQPFSPCISPRWTCQVWARVHVPWF